MAINFEVPEGEALDEVGSGGNFLKVGGTFHLLVIGTDEEPVWRGGKSKGELRDGIELEVSVVAGEHADKTARLFFRSGSASDKDGGSFSRIVLGRLFEALGLIDPTVRGKQVAIDLNDAKGRQFIATLKASDKGFIDPDGAKTWHVDDPNAPEGVERSQQAINLIDKRLRRDPESFPKKGAKDSNGNGHSNGAGAAKPSVDLSGI